MPDGSDYISNSYRALKDNLGGFNKSEDEYRKLVTTDAGYRGKVYSALKDNLNGFNKTPEEFENSIVVKKKEITSEPSSTGSQNISEKAPSQSKLTSQSLSVGIPEWMGGKRVEQHMVPIVEQHSSKQQAEEKPVSLQDVVFGKTPISDITKQGGVIDKAVQERENKVKNEPIIPRTSIKDAPKALAVPTEQEVGEFQEQRKTEKEQQVEQLHQTKKQVSDNFYNGNLSAKDVDFINEAVPKSTPYANDLTSQQYADLINNKTKNLRQFAKAATDGTVQSYLTTLTGLDTKKNQLNQEKTELDTKSFKSPEELKRLEEINGELQQLPDQEQFAKNSFNHLYEDTKTNKIIPGFISNLKGADGKGLDNFFLTHINPETEQLNAEGQASLAKMVKEYMDTGAGKDLNGVAKAYEHGTSLLVDPNETAYRDITRSIADEINHIPIAHAQQKYTRDFSEKNPEFNKLVNFQEQLRAGLTSKDADAFIKAKLDSGIVTISKEYQKRLQNIPEFNSTFSKYEQRVSSGMMSREMADKQIETELQSNPQIKSVFDKREKEYNDLRNKSIIEKQQYIVNQLKGQDAVEVSAGGDIVLKGKTKKQTDNLLRDYYKGLNETTTNKVSVLNTKRSEYSDEIAYRGGKYVGPFLASVGYSTNKILDGLTSWAYEKTGVGGDNARMFEAISETESPEYGKAAEHWKFKGASSLADPYFYQGQIGAAAPLVAGAALIGATAGVAGLPEYLSALGTAGLFTANNYIETRNELIRNGYDNQGNKISTGQADVISAEQARKELPLDFGLSYFNLGALTRTKNIVQPSITKSVLETLGHEGQSAAMMAEGAYLSKNSIEKAQGKPETDFFDFLSSDEGVNALMAGVAFLPLNIVKGVKGHIQSMKTWNDMVRTGDSEFANRSLYQNSLQHAFEGKLDTFIDNTSQHLMNESYKTPAEKQDIVNVRNYAQSLKKNLENTRISPKNINGLYTAHNLAMADMLEKSAAGVKENTPALADHLIKQIASYKDEAGKSFTGDAKYHYLMDNMDRPVFLSDKSAEVLTKNGTIKKWMDDGVVKDFIKSDDVEFSQKFKEGLQTVESPKVEEKFPARNDDFAYKYFNDAEKTKYAQLEKEGDTKEIAQMIEDKKKELSSPKQPIESFKTSKGSTYSINDDNSTTRNKAARDGDTEQGPQEKSQKTYYISNDDLNKLSEIQTTGEEKKAIAETSDGRIGVKYLTGKDAGKFENRTLVSPKDVPEIGMHPLEIWNEGKDHHFGNEITEVTTKKDEGSLDKDKGTPMSELDQKNEVVSDLQESIDNRQKAIDKAKEKGDNEKVNKWGEKQEQEKQRLEKLQSSLQATVDNANKLVPERESKDEQEQEKQKSIVIPKEVADSTGYISSETYPEAASEANLDSAARLRAEGDEEGAKKLEEAATKKEEEPEELPFGRQETIGVSHAHQIIRAYDTSAIQPLKGEGVSTEESIQRGKDLIESGLDVQKIVNDFNDTKRLSGDDMAVARAYYNELARNTNQAADDFGTDSEEYNKSFSDERGFYNNVVKPMSTEWSKIGMAQQGVTDIDTGSYVGLERAYTDVSNKSFTPEQAVRAKELAGKVKELEKENNGLQKKLDELYKTPEENKVQDKEKSIKKRATELAKKIRDNAKLSRPDTFSAASPASLVWDTAVELTAKAIEAGGTLAQAIADGVEHIKNSEWYKGLSDKEKDNAERQFTEWHNDFDKPEKGLSEKFIGKKDNKFTVDEAKDIWDYMKSKYLDKGMEFPDAINGVSTDLGLSSEQVINAAGTPKGARQITTEMFRVQYERRKAINSAKYFIANADKSKLQKAFNKLPSVFFNLKTWGHGTVGNITHAGPNIFRPSTWSAYWPNVIKSFSLAYGTTANYEKSITILKNSPNFTEWLQAGLAADPNKTYDEYQLMGSPQKKTKFGQTIQWLNETGTRGFSGLNFMRYDMAELLYSRASDAAKSDPEFRDHVAELVNHATGHSEIRVPKLIKVATFAPGLEVSRWQRMITDPAKAAKTFSNWNSSTPAEQAAAKIVASAAGEKMAIWGGLLAANAGLLYALGSSQKVNFEDPTKSDWLRFKFADKTFDVSGNVLSPVRLLSSLLGQAYLANTADAKDLKRKPGDKDASTLAQQARYKLSPIAGTVTDVGTGTDAMGNVLPWSNVKPATGKKKKTWQEFISQEALPIPVAAGLEAYWHSMEKSGMSNDEISGIMNGILLFGVEGFTGAKLQDDYSLDKKKDNKGLDGGGGSTIRY